MSHRVAVTRDGISIDGQPLYLLSGVVHYFRYPKAEWPALLRGALAAGLNTIDTVIPWNLHEPSEGQYDWAEEADLAAYLDLCQELGLYAIVRPGPYICAEWENGGFPAWLTGREGVELRVDNPIYLEATLRWFDALFAILRPRQLHAGGPIILCQIENEHWASGRYGHDSHQATLARAAIERGMTVPQYTCMGASPDWPEFRNGWSGIAEKLQQTRAVWPDNPMIVSELWSGWFDNWGASRHRHKSAPRLDQILHQLTAVGASGFSHWMWAGGTNFAFWGGRTVGGDTVHMTTSYDYDAPVDEYGRPTAKYAVARRHHLFLGTFGAGLAPVLAAALPGGPKVIAPAAVPGRGDAGSAPYRNVQAAPSAPEPWRDFTATFLQNSALEGQTYQLFLKNPAKHLSIEVEAASIKPVYTNLPLGQSPWLLRYHTSRILGFWRRDGGDLLVLYGFPGEVGEVGVSTTDDGRWTMGDRGPGAGEQRSRSDEPRVDALPRGFQAITGEGVLGLRYWIGEEATAMIVRGTAGDLTILLMTQEQAEMWGVGTGDWGGGSGSRKPDNEAQQHPDAASRFSVLSSRSSVLGPSPIVHHPSPIVHRPSSIVQWTRHTTHERTAPDGWRPIERPQPFEPLGCLLGYGWYRAMLELDAPRATTICAPWLSDRARLLIDGADCGWLGIHPHGPQSTLPLDLAAGRHELLLLVDNLGRFNYGSNTGEKKGLLDTLYWGGRQEDISAGWVALWQEAVFAGEAIARARPDAVRPDAADVHLGNFAFAGPSVWLLREITCEAGRRYVVQLTGDRNPGALFVNGQPVVRFSRHYSGGLIKYDISDKLQPGVNVLALNIQGYAGYPWAAQLISYRPEEALAAQWSFRPGVTPGPAEETGGGPAFFKATFPSPSEGRPAACQLALGPQGKGQIWLNGHNVGRYWQVGPQAAYKLPISWLLPDNELLLFDEEGAAPNGKIVWTMDSLDH